MLLLVRPPLHYMAGQQGYGGTFVDTSNAHKRRSHGGQQYQQRAQRSIGQQRQPIVDPKTSTAGFIFHLNVPHIQTWLTNSKDIIQEYP